MKKLLLDYPKEEARLLVNAAFEQCTQIKYYGGREFEISGNTGWSLFDWGSIVSVQFPETEKKEKTPIIIDSQRNVSINIVANPGNVEYIFTNKLEDLRGHSAGAVHEYIEETEGVVLDENFQKDNNELTEKDQILLNSGSRSDNDGSSNVGSSILYFIFVSIFFLVLLLIAIMLI